MAKTKLRDVTPKRGWWRFLADEQDIDFWFLNGGMGFIAFAALVVSAGVNVIYMTTASLFAQAGLAAVLLGVSIALFISLLEHQGFHKARKAKFGGRLFLRLLALGAFVGGMYCAVGWQMDLVEKDKAAYIAAESFDSSKFEQAEAVRNTEFEERAFVDAEQAFNLANVNLAQADAWATSIATARAAQAAGGPPDPIVTGIQAALNIRQDGVVRDQTAGAVRDNLIEARDAFSVADIRKAAALTALSQARERVRSGEVAALGLSANTAASRLSTIPSLRAWATRLLAQELSEPQAGPDATEAEEARAEALLIDEKAMNLALYIAVFFALIPNLASFGVGNFLRPHDDEDGEKDEPLSIIDQSGERQSTLPIGQSASPDVQGFAQGAPSSPQFHDYIAAGAPRQGWETDAAYTERVLRETAVIQQRISEMQAGASNSDLAAQDRAFAERKRAIAVAQLRKAQEDDLTRQETELGIGAPVTDTSSDAFEETTQTERRPSGGSSSSAGPEVAEVQEVVEQPVPARAPVVDRTLADINHDIATHQGEVDRLNAALSAIKAQDESPDRLRREADINTHIVNHSNIIMAKIEERERYVPRKNRARRLNGGGV